MLPTLRVLFAEIAACCSSMAGSMRFRKGLQRVGLCRNHLGLTAAPLAHPAEHQAAGVADGEHRTLAARAMS